MITTCFQAGGTLRPDAHYIERSADRELYDTLTAGEPCYVLAPRQIGKSSLRLRVQDRLTANGWCCIAIDVTTLGKVRQGALEIDWYAGLLAEIAIGLGQDAQEAWDSAPEGTPVRRFTQALRRLLAQEPRQVGLFIDEIDALRKAGIDHEGFLAGVRGICNLRAEDKVWRRLGLCIIGVATPDELINDSQLTPFNVGRAISLDDFSEKEVLGFAPGLAEAGAEANRAGELIHAVYKWAEGHPYLTQRLCQALAQEGPRPEPAAVRVESLVTRLFYSPQADTNLGYAERRFLDSECKVPLGQKVSLYRRLLVGENIPGDRQSRLHAELRLAGLIKDITPSPGGVPVLKLRNRIFTRIFDEHWVNGHSQHARLAEAMLRWKELGRPVELLLRATSLKDALASTEGQELEPDLAEFLRSSQEDERRRETEARFQAERLTQQQQRGVVGLVIALFTLSWALGGVFWNYRRANKEAERARNARSEAVEVADQILFVIQDELINISGTSSVQHKLLKSSHRLLERLLVGSPNDEQARYSMVVSHSHRGVLAFRQGRLTEAERELGMANESISILLNSAPDNRYYHYSLSTILSELGELAQARGQLDRAQEFFQRDLKLVRKRQEIEPNNLEAQDKLYASYVRLGDLAQIRGELEDARHHFQLGYDFAKRRLQKDPTNLQILISALCRLGDVALASGDLDAAEKAFLETKTKAEEQVQSDTYSYKARNNIAVSLERLGDVAEARGDLRSAERHFKRMREDAEQRLRLEPGNFGAEINFSVSLGRLGDLAKKNGDFELADSLYQQKLLISERLAKDEPDSSQAQQNLSLSLGRLGDLALARGRFDTAQAAFERKLAIDERRAHAEPRNSRAQRSLCRSLENIAEIEEERGLWDKAQQNLDRALRLTLVRAAAQEGNAEEQRTLLNERLLLAKFFSRRSQNATAREHLIAAKQVLDHLRARRMLTGDSDIKRLESELQSLQKKVANRDL